jgi:hypothetical protein
VDRPIPPGPIMDLSQLGKAQPIQPITVNIQFLLIGDQETLQDEMKELVTLLKKISANGQAAIERHNAKVKAKQMEGQGH